MIHQLKDSGILGKWLKDEFDPAIFLRVEEPAREEPLQLEDILLALSLLGLGLGLAWLALLLEVCRGRAGARQARRGQIY